MSTAKSEEPELRVVLDSNVFVSAFIHPRGVCFQIWSRAVVSRDRHLLCVKTFRGIAILHPTNFRLTLGGLD